MNQATYTEWCLIPFSYVHEGTPLRSLASQQAKKWAIDTARKLLEEEISWKKYEFLIEKELFNSFLFLAGDFWRIKIFKDMHPEINPKPKLIDDTDFFNFLKTYVPELDPYIENGETYQKMLLRQLKSLGHLLLDKYSIVILYFTKKQTKHKKIGHEIYEGLLYPAERSELNYIQHSDINPENLLFYFKKNVSLEERNIIDVFFKTSITILKSSTFEPKYRDHFQYNNKPSLWITKKYSSWETGIAWWKLFFRKFNINIWITPVEIGINNLIQRTAINSNGGLLLQKQRSECYNKAFAFGYNPADVMFTWSKFQAQHITDNGNHNRVVIPVGNTYGAGLNYQYKKIFDSLPIEIKDAEFKIALFDNGHGLNYPSSLEQNKEFFQELINWSYEKPNVVIIIKSKKNKNFINELLGINFIDSLVQNKKIFFIEENSTLLALNISIFCNISVGINISSAALEANISGLQALHYYPAFEKYHPLTISFENKIIFPHITTFIQALDEIYFNKNSTLGRLSAEEINLIDEYQGDGHGPARMGYIISKLFKAQQPLNELNNIEKILQHPLNPK